MRQMTPKIVTIRLNGLRPGPMKTCSFVAEDIRDSDGNSSGHLATCDGSLGFSVGGGCGSRRLPHPPPTPWARELPEAVRSPKRAREVTMTHIIFLPSA